MQKIDTGITPEKRHIDKDSELLLYLKETGKEKKEKMRKSFSIMQITIIVAGSVFVMAIIGCVILEIIGRDGFAIFEGLKYFWGLMAGVIIGNLGYSKGAAD